MSATTRIAAIAATQTVSGPGRQLAALAQRLRAMGGGVDVLILVLHRPGRPPSPYARFLEDAGLPHEVVPDRHPLDFSLARAVDTILRRWQPTVVQTHGYKATAAAFLLRRRGRAWPWIGCFHGATAENLKVRLYHRLDRWMLRRADRIVVPSRDQAALFPGCNGRVRLVRNAVIPLASIPDPEGEARLAALQATLAPPLLGVVGRLSREKGVDIFLDAAALMARRGTQFSAVIAGDGPERRALERQRDALGLTDRVHLVGQVQAMPLLYAGLDVLVIPSRSEGLPNVLLEALASGVAAVGTRVGAIPDVLGGLEDCAVVSPGSPQELADGIERVLTARRSGDASPAPRREVLHQYSLEQRVADHLALYEEVIGAA